MTGERVLVTGGAGFIGSHIVDAMLAEGHDVAVVDNLCTGRRQQVSPAARFHEADIRDAAALIEIWQQERPSVVCHQAALADVRGSLADPAGYALTNVIGTLNVLEASRLAGSVRKVLFASSGGAIYGDPVDLPARETDPARPLDPYGASKLACEAYLFGYRRTCGIDYCALRYGNVYGPRQDPNGEAGVIAIFAGALLEGRQPVIHGDGMQTRDYVYIDDVVRANMLALAYGSGVYNIAAERPTDVLTLFRALARATGYAGLPAQGPAKRGEVRHIFLNCGKASRELGWHAEIGLEEGIARTVEEVRRERGKVEGSRFKVQS
jgi:UDP-glucose 4-epimerase